MEYDKKHAVKIRQSLGKEDPLAFLAVVPGSQSLSNITRDVSSAVNARENLCGLLFVHLKRKEEQMSCQWLHLFQCLVKLRTKADVNCSCKPA